MIEILRPSIFDRTKVQSGVTKINKRMIPKTGLSLSPADILSEDEAKIHLNLFAHSRGISPDAIKSNIQVHSDIIHIVDSSYVSQDGDALITNKKGIMLIVKIADCAGILIYDKREEIAAAVHSGWKGTKEKILAKTIKRMIKDFNSKPENLLCYVSPCASIDKYEVGEEFLDYFPESTKKRGKNKYYFDNRSELKHQMLNSSIPEENIEISDICTITDTDYHSYRRDGKSSGRMAAFIMIKKGTKKI